MTPGNLVAVGAALLLGASACAAGADAGSGSSVVASLYPPAFAAERVAGPSTDVIDLTPAGAEAHDIELSLEQRSAIEEADLVLYLGDLGFQPQVEAAVEDASGTVIDLTGSLELLEGHPDEHAEEEGTEVPVDPHVWLDPVRFSEMVDGITAALAEVDRDPADDLEGRADALLGELASLDEEYRSSLEGCETHTMVVSHEAFGYLADRYGLEQVGLAGTTPEAEPTVQALGEAGELLSSGQAHAVFYEADAESKRIAESVAGDFDLPALPLGTLESQPVGGDYLSVMADNLDSLRRGLGCE
ncbi:MAG: metal ABC transporter substrate-binding protein [Actinomycetota bacterium]|nr:metal ABC transporter substrate-binding protein [Actinomycetota bacterium]